MKARSLIFFLPVLLMLACASPAASTREVMPTSSITETGVGEVEAQSHPLSTRTGIPDIDVVLDAVESGDPNALRELFRYTRTSCTNAEGLGGPPKCRDGEAAGTMVEVLPFLGPEGSFLRVDEVGDFPGLNVTGLYAVYQVSEKAYSDEDYPAGEYAAIFVGDSNLSTVILQITEGGIVRIDYVFDPETLKTIVERDASGLILPPGA